MSYKYEKDRVPPPEVVLQDALSRIRPDGTVLVRDEKGIKAKDNGSEHFKIVEPDPPVIMPDEWWLWFIGNCLAGVCGGLADFPEKAEDILNNFAVYLTPYRHKPDLVWDAASTVEVEAETLIRAPTQSKVDAILVRRKNT